MRRFHCLKWKRKNVLEPHLSFGRWSAKVMSKKARRPDLRPERKHRSRFGWHHKSYTMLRRKKTLAFPFESKPKKKQGWNAEVSRENRRENVKKQ
jgi:hypothetical protein